MWFYPYRKHCNKFSLTNASRQKVNLTHGKRDNMEKTSARQIHHNTKTWQIQHDKEKGRNMNLSHSKEPVQSSAYSGTHCVLDVQIMFWHVRRAKILFSKIFFILWNQNSPCNLLESLSGTLKPPKNNALTYALYLWLHQH